MFNRRLVLAMILISLGSNVPTEASASDLRRKLVRALPVDRNSDQTTVKFTTESLFDSLFGQRKNGVVTYNIPYPFTAVIRRLAAQFTGREGRSSPIMQTLIPLGRSLQRYAAEPEYFKYPRVVVAVDAEPTSPPENRGLFLKDRIYLAYQEKANAIEVISYNENAGRFEFQVVHDYVPGGTPAVSYASRTLCMGCHQNGGPIWSEPPWEETNVNPRIVSLLQKHNSEFHGVPVNLAFEGTEVAFRIASSINRANLFAPHQRLWQQACGSSFRCRGNVLELMLQYRLSGNRGYDRFASALEDAFKVGWNARVPEGLEIQNPRIPNRDPLNSTNSESQEHDPLEPRPPINYLRPSDAGAVESVIAGLSKFLPEVDIRLLDNFLFEAGRGSEPARQFLKSDCAFTKSNLGDWALQIRFSCGSQDRGGPTIVGQFYINPGEKPRGTIERLLIGEFEALIKLKITGSQIEHFESGGKVVLSIEQPIGRIHARLTNGRALEHLTLSWNGLAEEDAEPSAELHRHPNNGTSVLSVVDDFAPLQTAINTLVQESENGANSVSNKPIKGGALMQALFTQLGMEPIR